MCFYFRFICLCIYLFLVLLRFNVSLARHRGWAGPVAMVTPKPKVVICLQAVRLPLSLGSKLVYRTNTMAFFGITHLGYQNPIGDKMVVNPRGASRPQGKS